MTRITPSGDSGEREASGIGLGHPNARLNDVNSILVSQKSLRANRVLVCQMHMTAYVVNNIGRTTYI